MTVEANPTPAVSAEERLRARALDAVKTQALEAILASDEPLRTVDLARSVADRVGLTLSEEELGGLASLVRMLLDSDPMFSQSNRQWDLAVRMGRAEADRRKPVERAIEDYIDLLGHPADPALVAALVAAVYGRTPDYYLTMIARIAPVREQFFLARDGRVAITRWLPQITSDDPEEVEWDNFDDPGLLEPWRSHAPAKAAESPGAFARALVGKAGEPVPVKSLLFLTWAAFPDSEPQAVFNDLYAAGDLRMGRGPVWITAADHARILDAIRSLAGKPDEVAGLVAAVTPHEEEELGLLTATTARVSDDDLDQVYDFVSAEPRTYRLSELCQQVLEAFPGSRTYSDIFASLRARMQEDRRFTWVGTERFRRSGTIPEEVQALPEGLAFDEGEYLGEEGVEVDRLVDPREWKGNLIDQVDHYLVQELGDDATSAPAVPPARLESSPPLHHYVAGTRYLRNADRGFFPGEPDLLQISLLVPDGGRFDVWVNHRLSLILGLKEWYDANLPWVGGKYVLEPTALPDEFQLSYADEAEPLMEIPMERLQELLILRGEAANEGLPLTEVVLRILKAHASGVEFVTLFAEVNIVRRVRRVQVASVLSSQRYFAQNGSTGLWTYDEKRAAKATKKKGGPRRPTREVYNEEDEEFEFE